MLVFDITRILYRMENAFSIKKYQRIHFIGIAGVSMNALARYLVFMGKTVSGSDLVDRAECDELRSLGVEVFIGHSKANVKGADLVVYSHAIDHNNPEISMAKKLNTPLISRSKLLGAIVSEFKNSIAVAGSHGKTTTTAMISRALAISGKDPTVFLGGEDRDFGNLKIGASSYAVIEACEFKRSMNDICPKIAVVLNVDNDHLDCYGDMDELSNAFKQFTDGRLNVVNADDKNCERVRNCSSVTFGIENRANYYAKNVKSDKDGYSFTACAYSRAYGKIKLKVLGKHNVYNALATIAVCSELGISFTKIKRALESFRDVGRRNEYLGKYLGHECYADYAHHPTEIKAINDALLEKYENFITIFQPHTYSRTRILMNDFVSVLKQTKPLIIYKTYPAREPFDELGSAERLAENLTNSGCECVYASNELELTDYIKRYATKNEKIIFLGAGNIYEIATKLTDKNNIFKR